MTDGGATRLRCGPFANRLVIMAKSPRRGAVKRRLASEIGEGAALRFYRSCLSHSVMRLAGDPRWLTLLAIAPDREVASTVLPSRLRVQCVPQGTGDLGERMQHLFELLPPGPVILVGSDIPAIAPGLIAEAFVLLKGSDAVFGKARDGGYWLVGLKRGPRLLAPFRNVRWSSSHALADTLSNLDGRRIAFVATLSDVDTEDDFRRERCLAERLV
ncbi:MAG TPA: TIGR04282 family arsenosugar biosynthesis glycosyltransferase [Methyloceanibacter sp.]|nr:TIGR04282 family arsenosugar biosynthesis glycosyltransferase [Methyloceanibacter sp.]